jgi:type VI protein secretion system component Hcp
MRTIIALLLLLPVVSVAQKTDVFIKLTDANGQQIKGDALLKGFERNITALSFTTGGKNNSQLTFSMNVTGATADLKRAMGNGMVLPAGMLTVTQPAMNAPTISYTIKMENIKVNSCAESMGCNGITTTTAVITATRIGWTYYQNNGGKQTISNKYGYDADTGREWTNF